MSDGKVVRTWEGEDTKILATSKCEICGADAEERHKRHGKFKARQHILKYGIKNLHVRIRAFEFIFKAGMYRDVKARAAYGPENQASIKKWKEYQIDQFDKRLKLDVYKVIAGNIGNSNTGNTSRYKLFYSW